MEIREATVADAPAFRQLRFKIDSETDTWGADPDERYKSDEAAADMIREVSGQGNSFLWLVEDEQKLVGFLLGKGLKWRRARHTVGIDIGLLQAYCGRGVGDTLFSKLEDWTREQKTIRIEFFVYERNKRARSFYKKWGYQEEGTRTGSLYVNGSLSNEIWMSKLFRE